MESWYWNGAVSETKRLCSNGKMGNLFTHLLMYHDVLRTCATLFTELSKAARWCQIWQIPLFSTLLPILLCQNFAIFWNTNCQYWQNNPFQIIYQMNMQTSEKKYSSTLIFVNYYIILLVILQFLRIIVTSTVFYNGTWVLPTPSSCSDIPLSTRTRHVA